MRAVGIDPGYDRLGIAVIEKTPHGEVVLESLCVETSKKDSPEMRLKQIADSFRATIEKHRPDIIGIESLFFNNNQKTAIRVAEARGVILVESAHHSLPIQEYTPSQIKLAVTGHGQSDKQQVMDMIPRLVKIDKNIKHDDEFDAIAVALTSLAHTKTI